MSWAPVAHPYNPIFLEPKIKTVKYQASIGKIICETPSQCKKGGHGDSKLSSRDLGKHKIGGPWSRGPISRINRAQRAGDIVQVVKHLFTKNEALSLSPCTAKIK
jgi:hypothetical protein